VGEMSAELGPMKFANWGIFWQSEFISERDDDTPRLVSYLTQGLALQRPQGSRRGFAIHEQGGPHPHDCTVSQESAYR